MNKYDLTGRIAMVTGARRGIGKAIALRLAKDGATVAVTDINKEECETVVKQIEGLGTKGLALKLDVAEEVEIKEAIKAVNDTFGRIDILVNNAGINIPHGLDGMDTSTIDRILAVDLRGVILCTKYLLPIMKAQNYGKIVNIASISSFVTYNPIFSIYCAAKGGIVSFTKEQAVELGKYKINVNAVAPGAIETALTKSWIADEKIRTERLAKIPYGRIGQPEDIANAVVFLVSDDSEYITGHTLVVDGGWLAV
ncbi:SDR family NAD(P)-dependent oxidoreductase [Chloroflexota bacterium]